METMDAPLGESLIDWYIGQRRAAEPRFSKIAFAEMCGVSRGAIYRILSGDTAVSTDMFHKIEAATGGAIKATALFAEWDARTKQRDSEPQPAATAPQPAPPRPQPKITAAAARRAETFERIQRGGG